MAILIYAKRNLFPFGRNTLWIWAIAGIATVGFLLRSRAHALGQVQRNMDECSILASDLDKEEGPNYVDARNALADMTRALHDLVSQRPETRRLDRLYPEFSAQRELLKVLEQLIDRTDDPGTAHEAIRTATAMLEKFVQKARDRWPQPVTYPLTSEVPLSGESLRQLTDAFTQFHQDAAALAKEPGFDQGFSACMSSRTAAFLLVINWPEYHRTSGHRERIRQFSEDLKTSRALLTGPAREHASEDERKYLAAYAASLQRRLDIIEARSNNDVVRIRQLVAVDCAAGQ